jgi:hypothetical protein
MILAATRTFTAADELARGRAPEDARCLADELTRRSTLDELESGIEPADMADRRAAAEAACQLG